ncbi:MAG: hypothetical protein WBD40_13010 [Tepidisphaeraceae bacterium]
MPKFFSSSRVNSSASKHAPAEVSPTRMRALSARDSRVTRAAAMTVEALERRTLFGFYYGDPTDENPTPTENPCPPVPADPNAGAGTASSTGEPVRHFDGHPLVTSADLSSEGFGFSWGHTRSWTGLNNASLNGNGWSIAELPYAVVGGGATGSANGDWIGDPNNEYEGVLDGTARDQRLSVVSGGGNVSTFEVGVPADYQNGTYASYAPWGGAPEQVGVGQDEPPAQADGRAGQRHRVLRRAPRQRRD